MTGLTGEYILENLIPKTTYDFRFGSKNLVGFSDWGAARQLTMPARGPPEPPRIETNVSKDRDIIEISNTLIIKRSELGHSLCLCCFL